VTFSFYRFRFLFRARETVHFPPGKAGNVIRGVFGDILRRIACVPDCRGAGKCQIRNACAYARLFEPGAADTGGPSGLQDWPRPFVLRASHLDGVTVRAKEDFWWDVHVFDLQEPALAYFVLTFAQLAREGMGPRRGRADLKAAAQLDLNGAVMELAFDGETFCVKGRLPAPLALDLRANGEKAERAVVRFVTPTELKGGGGVAERPEFGVLFGRIRDRVSTLRALYSGEGPLEVDHRALGERAKGVKLVRWDWARQEVTRRSSKTGQWHSMGGFVGEAEYQGDLGEFLPWLRAAKWAGVGRQTVWGKGEVEVEELRS
jgi:hypothetical protein